MLERVVQNYSDVLLESLFDSMPDVVFCVKDLEGRYQTVNQAFVERLDVESKSDVIGKKADDFFPMDLATVYAHQDATVIAEGRPIQDQLERITHRDGSMGWFLASKFPVINPDEQVLAVVGISQDLHTPSDSDLELSNLKAMVEYIKSHLDQPLRVEQIAEQFGLSQVQMDRRMKRVFRLSTKKFIMKCRLEETVRRLVFSDESLSEIAMACGFSDQSSFSRQFRAATNQTPLNYRRMHQA